MGKETGIAWTDHTFNIAWGCMKVSPGCKHCYAETFSKRTGHDIWGPPETTSRRTFGMKHWAELFVWNAAAERAGVVRNVFCSSMADIFENHPAIISELAKLWWVIGMTPWLNYQLLTKRPERIPESLPPDWGLGYPNVWLGTSIESPEYIPRVKALLRNPARLHFLSVEPLLTAFGHQEAMDLFAEVVDDGGRLQRIRWMIVGGESGPGHREMPLETAQHLVTLSRLLDVRVFVKQDSGPKPGRQGRIPNYDWIQEMPR